VLKYLHAPLSNGNAQIAEQPLVDYLTTYKKQTAIIVTRPTEPTA